MDTSGIILAGGKGRRLGCRDKASEIINHGRLLERVVSSLSFLDSIIIVTGDARQVLPRLEGTPPVKVVADVYPGKGPLGGIYSGLAASGTPRNLVVACDMPFLNQGLLRYLIEVSDKFDAVVLRLGEALEPLHAVYSKSCLEPIKRMLAKGNLNVRQLFDMVRVRYVTTEEIERFDPEHLSFFNINTRQDLKLARKISCQREK
ncbi:MAG: molybdenum cofactor guanylyltransferase [Chloroflexota bacterium]